MALDPHRLMIAAGIGTGLAAIITAAVIVQTGGLIPDRELPSHDLRAITAVSEDRVYAGGDNGVLVEWDGQDWINHSTPADRQIRDIEVAGEEIWIATSSDRYKGSIYQYNDGSWSERAPRNDAYINIDLVNGTLWAIGHRHPDSDGGEQSASLGVTRIYRYQDGSWERTLDQQRGELSALHFEGPESGIAAGLLENGSSIFHWDGQDWKTESLQLEESFHPISVSSIDDRTLIIGFPFSGNQSVIWETESGWQPDAPPTGERLWGLDVLEGTAYIAAGSGTVLNWDGDWTTHPTNTTATLYDISMLGTDDGWAVGTNHTILRYNGTAWTSVTRP